MECGIIRKIQVIRTATSKAGKLSRLSIRWGRLIVTSCVVTVKSCGSPLRFRTNEQTLQRQLRCVQFLPEPTLSRLWAAMPSGRLETFVPVVCKSNGVVRDAPVVNKEACRDCSEASRSRKSPPQIGNMYRQFGSCYERYS